MQGVPTSAQEMGIIPRVVKALFLKKARMKKVSLSSALPLFHWGHRLTEFLVRSVYIYISLAQGRYQTLCRVSRNLQG